MALTEIDRPCQWARGSVLPAARRPAALVLEVPRYKPWWRYFYSSADDKIGAKPLPLNAEHVRMVHELCDKVQSFHTRLLGPLLSSLPPTLVAYGTQTALGSAGADPPTRSLTDTTIRISLPLSRKQGYPLPSLIFNPALVRHGESIVRTGDRGVLRPWAEMTPPARTCSC